MADPARNRRQRRAAQAHRHVGLTTTPADPHARSYLSDPFASAPVSLLRCSHKLSGAATALGFPLAAATRESEAGMAAAVGDDAGMDAVQRRLMFEDE